MDEEKRARAGDTAETPRKSPRLEPPAAPTEADSCGGGGAAPPGVSNPFEEAAALTSNSSTQRCEHVLCEQDDIDLVITAIRYCGYAPMCHGYRCTIVGATDMLVCLVCELRFCHEHASSHAVATEHWVVLMFKKPNVAYCYECKVAFDISLAARMKIDDDVSNPFKEAAALTSNSSTQRCEHVLCEQDDIDMAITAIRYCGYAPMCHGYRCTIVGTTDMLVCLVCELRFCHEHASSHAVATEHWVVLMFKKPNVAYCYECKVAFDISLAGRMKIDDDVSNPFEEAAALTSNSSTQRCEHVLCEQDDIDMAITAIRYCGYAPMCHGYRCTIIDTTDMLVCLVCELRFCHEHASSHAVATEHWVVLMFEKPNVAYCYECKVAFDISLAGRMKIDDDVFFISTRKKDEWGMVVDYEAGGHESGLAGGHAHAIKGIPNHGNTCYLNSLVQCLLVLEKLRERMLGPDAPMMLIGTALRDLFEDAGSVSNTRGPLDPSMLLACVWSLDTRFEGSSMQDSHELLCCLRDGLNEGRKPPNMQEGGPSAEAPTAIDSIFGGQLLVTTSCKRCSLKSVSHDVFYDLSVPLPTKGSPVTSFPVKSWIKGRRTPRKIHLKLPPLIDKSNKERNLTIAEGSYSQSPASESKDVAVVKTSEPLKVDSTKVEEISQSSDAVHGPLQTQEEAQGQGIQALLKAVDFLSQNTLFDVKVEGMDVIAADSHIPEDIPELINEPELIAEAKTLPAEVISEDKGKSQSSNTVYNEAEVIKPLASIEECLELHFKAEMIEWTCDSCSKAAQNPGIIPGKYSEPMMSSTNQDTTVDGDQTEQSEKITGRNEQSSNLNSSAVEGTSSSMQPHGSDSQNQVMLTVDSITKGITITPGRICVEQDLASDSIANKKPESHDGAQEAIPSCIPAEKRANLLSCQDQNASTLDEGRGEEVKLHHSALQVEENQSEQEDMNKGAIQTRLISKLPPVLVIHLKRSLRSDKVIGHVSFKEILDMGLFVDPSYEDKDNSSYRLAGVVEHRGHGNDAGHYVAYVRASHRQQTSGSSSWFLANDVNIKEISLEKVLECEAYLLFYERMEG